MWHLYFDTCCPTVTTSVTDVEAEEVLWTRTCMTQMLPSLMFVRKFQYNPCSWTTSVWSEVVYIRFATSDVWGTSFTHQNVFSRCCGELLHSMWKSDYKFENEYKCGGVEREREREREVTRPLQSAPDICTKLRSTLAASCITHLKTPAFFLTVCCELETHPHCRHCHANRGRGAETFKAEGPWLPLVSCWDSRTACKALPEDLRLQPGS